ncbi:MAG: TonB-dependent receptor [Rubrivivax sp.]
MTSPSLARASRAARLPLLVALSPLALATAALAQSAPAGADTVVVTANRTPQPLSSVLADISVVDRAAIERSGALSVADLLARQPGVEISRSGGPSATTSVFIRGAENRHTAVYIDGVRVDSQSTGGPLWEQIPLEQIDRIEVLRGPAAAIYGSDAVGGVVQLFTRRGQGAPKPWVSVTAGSYRTAQVQAGISGAAQGLDYSLSASHGRSDGFDSRTAAAAGHTPDDDGWRRNSVQARVGWQFNPAHRIDASLLASRMKSQYDGFTPGFDDWSYHSLRSGSLSWQGRWTDDATTRLQLGQTESTYETQPDYYRTETTLRNYTLQHEQRVAGNQLLTATLERREDELLNPATAFTSTLEGKRHQDAVGLGWRGDFGAHGLQAHVRRDDDSEFGGKTTGSLAWGWAFVPQWRLTASAATSFRVPTLYQRFSQYGNPSLVPESGRNVELGLRWAAAPGQGSEASLTAWRNKVTNLIAFGSPGPCVDSFGCYANVGRAELKGATLAGRTQWAKVNLRGSLDWHDPRNLDTDKILQRRAKRLATFGADTQWAGWTFGAEVQAAGRRYENAANTQVLGGYGLLNLFVSTRLMAGLSLDARIDNVADKAYELARAYATAGRSAQVTLRWTMP